MLSSFFIQNFRSILELKLDFSYDEGKAPNGYKELEILPFHEGANKQRLVPCTAFFGANAAGKSNIVKALSTFKQLLVFDSVNLSQLFEPDLLNHKFNDTTFGIEYILNGDAFEYRITYDENEIVEEIFKKNGEPIYVIGHLVAKFSSRIISDTYSDVKLNDILRVECSKGGGRQTKPFLNCIGFRYPGLNEDLRNSFFYFQKRLNIYTNDELILLPIAVDILASALGGDKKDALGKITDVVRKLDVDIGVIDIILKQIAPNGPVRDGITQLDRVTGTQYALTITTTHNDVAGNPTMLDFIKNESDGTQRLAGIVGLILYTIKIGGVLLVDELERSLHPLLMREIVMLFKKRRFNQNGAQLIFTTHSTDILDDSILRLSEIALVRKTTVSGTMVRRLVDAKKDGEDIRNVTNFRKQYLAGFYAGIPHPAL